MRKLAMPAMALAIGLLAGCCGGTCGNGNGKKDYFYVEDLSEIMIRLIEKGLAPFG